MLAARKTTPLPTATDNKKSVQMDAHQRRRRGQERSNTIPGRRNAGWPGARQLCARGEQAEKTRIIQPDHRHPTADASHAPALHLQGVCSGTGHFTNRTHPAQSAPLDGGMPLALSREPRARQHIFCLTSVSQKHVGFPSLNSILPLSEGQHKCSAAFVALGLQIATGMRSWLRLPRTPMSVGRIRYGANCRGQAS